VVGGAVEFAHSPLCKMKMVMSQMQFVGSMRFRFRPLVPLVPIVAGMSISMMVRTTKQTQPQPQGGLVVYCFAVDGLNSDT
jgi:hypothetical protein